MHSLFRHMAVLFETSGDMEMEDAALGTYEFCTTVIIYNYT